MQAMRDSVASGSGPWEHATPEQREQQIKLLDDQIRSTAETALDQHHQSQPELAPSAPRTPEENAARQREVAAAREETAQRDRQLVEDTTDGAVLTEVDESRYRADIPDGGALRVSFEDEAHELL
jgi:hypothetical protein